MVEECSLRACPDHDVMFTAEMFQLPFGNGRYMSVFVSEPLYKLLFSTFGSTRHVMGFGDYRIYLVIVFFVIGFYWCDPDPLLLHNKCCDPAQLHLPIVEENPHLPGFPPFGVPLDDLSCTPPVFPMLYPLPTMKLHEARVVHRHQRGSSSLRKKAGDWHHQRAYCLTFIASTAQS